MLARLSHAKPRTYVDRPARVGPQRCERSGQSCGPQQNRSRRVLAAAAAAATIIDTVSAISTVNLATDAIDDRSSRAVTEELLAQIVREDRELREELEEKGINLDGTPFRLRSMTAALRHLAAQQTKLQLTGRIGNKVLAAASVVALANVAEGLEQDCHFWDTAARMSASVAHQHTQYYKELGGPDDPNVLNGLLQKIDAKIPELNAAAGNVRKQVDHFKSFMVDPELEGFVKHWQGAAAEETHLIQDVLDAHTQHLPADLALWRVENDIFDDDLDLREAYMRADERLRHHDKRAAAAADKRHGALAAALRHRAELQSEWRSEMSRLCRVYKIIETTDLVTANSTRPEAASASIMARPINSRSVPIGNISTS